MEESGDGNRRRRPPTPMEEAPVRRGPITQDESHFGAGESGLSRRRRRRRRRPRRSGTHSESQASSSVAPPVDGGAADPDSPTGPRVVFSDGRIHGVYTREFLKEYLSSQSRQRPETRSQAPSSSSAPRSDHPGAEGGTRVRQSVLYSDRPRRSRPRRQTPAEEHPGIVSSSELGRLVTDSPTFEALSLIDSPPLTPQTTDAEESDNDEAPPEHVRSGFGFRTCSARPPRPKWSGGVRGQGKWSGGVRGQGMLEKHAGDANNSELVQSITDLSRSEALSLTVSSFSTSEKPTEDSDDDTEEELRLLEEYFDAHPPTSISQAFDELEAANHAALTSLAAEWGIEPPPPLSPPRRQFLADQEQQKMSTAVAHHNPQCFLVLIVGNLGCKLSKNPLWQEASDEEIVENAKKWMRDEVALVFEDYIGRRDDLKIVDYHLDELCYQCVSVEDYHNIFHHYNFTVKLKKVNSDDWVGALYFAEVKQMFGRKSYFCCRLEPNENGHCNACQNQGVNDLRHPATRGFTGVGYGLWYPDEF
ncbi:uncharacterized protein LOC120680930 [Panicum virgatum]|uniref:uncharacterized protein LOC120680930 n=1 Tax=Panicum virgatum TaxID=38727 RepID=UPI0019D552A7|nr:uncharacterized protein LOC120680930 [Panicum virgatum]